MKHLIFRLFGPLLIVLSSTAASLYTVTNLGTLGGPSTFADSINASGQVTGQSSNDEVGTFTNPVFHAFLYSNGVMSDLGVPLGGVGSTGAAINNSGQIVGTSYTGLFPHPNNNFLYSNGTVTDLGPLTPEAINNSGEIAGVNSGEIDGVTGAAAIYKNGVITSLGVVATPAGINDSGQVVLWTYTPTNPGPVGRTLLYSNGVITDLGTLGGEFSRGTAINNSGQVVGRSATNGFNDQHAFLYSNGRMIDLGTLGGATSQALAINNSGQVTGEADTATTFNRAFIYSDGVMTDLNSLIDPSLGILLLEGTGINDAGQILVEGIYNDAPGAELSFLLTPLATPVPEPSTFALLAAPLCGAFLITARKRNAI